MDIDTSDIVYEEKGKGLFIQGRVVGEVVKKIKSGERSAENDREGD